MAGGCGIDAVPNQYGRAEIRGRYQTNVFRLLQTGYYGHEEGRNDSTVLNKLPMFTGFAT